MATLLDIGVKFGAEGVPEVTRSVRELEQQMKRFQQGLNVATGVDSISRLNRAIAETGNRIRAIQGFRGLSTIPNEAAAAADGIEKVTRASNAGFQGLSAFNHVVQDAPFGLIGIGNNITELPNAFKNLSNAAKESGQSIGKILLGSLTGAGGLLTVISLVTTGLTFATSGFGAWTRGMGDNSKAIKENKDEVNLLAKAYEGVTDKVAQARVLGSVISSSAPLIERKRALEDLKRLNESYFGDLTLEGTKYDTLTNKINEYSRALIYANVQKLRGEEVTKAQVDVQDIRVQLQDLDEQIRRQQKLTKARFEDLKARGLADLAGVQSVNDLIRKDDKLVGLGAKRLEIYDKLGEAETKLGNLSIQFENAVTAALKFQNTEREKPSKTKSAKDDEELKRLNAELKAFQDRLKDIDALRQSGLLPKFLEGDAGDLQLKIFDQLRKIDAREVELKLKPKTEIDPQIEILQIQNALKEAATRAGLALTIPISPVPRGAADVAGATGGVDPAKVQEMADKLRDATKAKIEFDKAIRDAAAVMEFQDNVAKILANSLQDLTSTFGDALAEVFNTGDLGKGLAIAAQNILRIIGDTLQQIGKQVVLASTLVETLKKVLSTAGFGGASIAVGIGLIAAGAFIKNIKLPQFAQGGISDGPKSGYLALLHGREMITPLDRARTSVGLSDRNDGGLVAEVVMRGEDQYIQFFRVHKRLGRTGGQQVI